MTQDTSTVEQAIVTQDDRDRAAKALWDLNLPRTEDQVAAIEYGECDETSLVQAFAHHRIAALAKPVASPEDLEADILDAIWRENVRVIHGTMEFDDAKRLSRRIAALVKPVAPDALSEPTQRMAGILGVPFERESKVQRTASPDALVERLHRLAPTLCPADGMAIYALIDELAALAKPVSSPDADERPICPHDNCHRREPCEGRAASFCYYETPNPTASPDALVERVFGENGRMQPEMAGRALVLAATVAYPGSRVSDVRVGSVTFQVANEELRLALSSPRPVASPDALVHVLRAIAENYPTHGEEDRYIVVENPAFAPDNGTDPCLIIDVEALSSPDVDEVREAVVQQLRDALGRYGIHKSSCNVARALPYEIRSGSVVCTCGLDQALASLEGVSDGQV